MANILFRPEFPWKTKCHCITKCHWKTEQRATIGIPNTFGIPAPTVLTNSYRVAGKKGMVETSNPLRGTSPPPPLEPHTSFVVLTWKVNWLLPKLCTDKLMLLPQWRCPELPNHLAVKWPQLESCTSYDSSEPSVAKNKMLFNYEKNKRMLISIHNRYVFLYILNSSAKIQKVIALLICFSGLKKITWCDY